MYIAKVAKDKIEGGLGASSDGVYEYVLVCSGFWSQSRIFLERLNGMYLPLKLFGNINYLTTTFNFAHLCYTHSE